MRRALALILAGMMMFSFLGKSVQAASSAKTDASGFSFTSIDGEQLPLSAYAGKAVLIVNTASQCGYTPQYEGLEKLYQTYRERGLVVLGVPSNDFGGQEPGTSAEIKHFCQLNYDITFPLTQKEIVSGKSAHPFYQWAADQKLGGMIFSKPRWNFHKYLLRPDGTLAGSYSSATKPDDQTLIEAIESVLPPKP